MPTKMKLKYALNIESRDDVVTIYKKKTTGGYYWNDYKKSQVSKSLYDKDCYVERLGGMVSIRLV